MDKGNDEYQALWTAMLQGDKAGFSRIHEYFYSHLLTYASRFTKDILLAEECVQDLFVKIWMNRANIGTPISVRFYLFKALRNVLYNRLSRVQKEQQIGSLQDFMVFDLSFDTIVENNSEQSIRIRQLLNKLTPRQQEAVYLFYFEGLSYSEIAEALQMQTGGVYKLIYRALDNMRTHADVISILLTCFYMQLQQTTSLAENI